MYQWDEAYMESRYEVLNLKIVHRRRRTGFEETKDISIHVNDLIASRYQVLASHQHMLCLRVQSQ